MARPLQVLRIVTVSLVALALVPAAAHVLELPGKKRLRRDEYLVVQRIYYPGFTLAGVAEVGAIPAALALALATPRRSPAFGWTVAALLGMAGMHAVFWLFTQPANRDWVRAEPLTPAGARFFSVGASAPREPAEPSRGWMKMRDRWERSHVLRAALGAASLFSLLAAESTSGRA